MTSEDERELREQSMLGRSTQCFSHLAVLSFESVFFWKLSLTRLLRLISLTHQTTKLLFLLAQEQNLLSPGSRTWVFPALLFGLPFWPTMFPQAQFFLVCHEWSTQFLASAEVLSYLCLLFLFAAGESWGHASTIRIVLYWEDNQRYTQQTFLYYFMDS